ncbi:carboxymuconolactone decarboxylase family protein [Nocardia goodfellowii]|uniref:AhpD family alkylhydroperoxidase n=1 Tax=Nocardia goodfellowii TaxID=882446 RepID=A0ABS4QJR4_9NOCA|nr:carboxymuconolactone decarboxylase family protein [Nocardia goodfellowii]MBP2191942.1 AhpD family alkylhydroperoxidase [Nocardia goodfellowii]
MRLPPLPAESWDDHTRAAFRQLLPAARRNPEGAGPAMSVLAHHPELTEAFLGFSVYLLFRSSLPPRIRELAILRVAHRTDCAYEWQHHAGFAATAGLSEADIAAVQNGTAATEFDRVVIDAADELLDKSTLSDHTWTALGEQLSDRQRMDLVFTVGGYSLLAMAFNTFGVTPEHER